MMAFTSQKAAELQRQQAQQRLAASLPESGFVREAQLIPLIIPVSSATLWRWSRDGRFPRPVRLGPRVTAWRVEDVRAWLAEKRVQ